MVFALAAGLGLAAAAPVRADEPPAPETVEESAALAEADARAALARGDLERAAELARAAERLAPSEERRAFRDETVSLAVHEFRFRGDGAFAAGRWADALAFYEEAADFAPGEPKLKERVTAARQRLALENSLAAQARGDIAAASDHAQRAEELERELAEHRRLSRLSPDAPAPADAPAWSGARIYESRRDSIVLVESTAGDALGVVIEPGVVLTQRSALSGPSGKLRLVGGGSLPFFRTAPHTQVDLALVFVGELDRESVPMASGLRIERGSRVSLIGAQGMDLGYEDGAVVRVGRALAGPAQLIQFTGPVFTGTGGLLFDEKGQLVGYGLPAVMGGPGFHYAIPVEYALELLEGARTTATSD